jgi:hypothetical protein
MYTVKKILDRSVSNWSQILGCSKEKTITKTKKKTTTKKKASKKQ